MAENAVAPTQLVPDAWIWSCHGIEMVPLVALAILRRMVELFQIRPNFPGQSDHGHSTERLRVVRPTKQFD